MLQLHFFLLPLGVAAASLGGIFHRPGLTCDGLVILSLGHKTILENNVGKKKKAGIFLPCVYS